MIRRFAIGASAMAIVVAACTDEGTASAGSAAAQGTAATETRTISAEEKAQGAKAHPELLKEFGGAYSGAQSSYVVDVGKKIAVQSGLGNAESDFTVTLLNSPVNNAFAIPGGYVYITRQLAALANDEAEMAGVLGHEVGHVAARHAEKRQKAAQRNAIIGVLGQIAGGLLGGGSGAGAALGGVLQQYSGAVAQIFTLKYSRAQEEEADDLGIRYLNSAGYDEQALSRMLYSLALQNNVDAAAAGRDARSIPEWASTHPDPARRVTRASKVANNFPAGGTRNSERHMQAIDGMLFGDDPKQGVIEGQSFLHPDLKLQFTVPNGFGMQNGTTAVTISGQSGQAQFSTGPYSGNLSNYISSVFNALAGEGKTLSHSAVQNTTVNGIPAAYAQARVNTQSGQVDATVFAYEFSKTQAYHFVSVAKAGTNPFGSMYSSLQRLSTAEAAKIKPRKIDVVTVKSSDTIDGLASRMAYTRLQKERFLALNGMNSSSRLTAGQKVKIVTY